VKAHAAEDASELDQIADELYGLRADAFAAARDEQVRKARADGRAALARELNKLRKPTQSAWLINLLWRDQRDVMQQLFELAEALSQAQAEASGPALLRLTAQRREVEAALMRRARVLADQAGVGVSAAMEREAQETLAAAVALPEVAEEVRTGRLVKPAAYAGFGTLVPTAAPARAEKPSPADDTASKRPVPTQPAQLDDFEAHAAQRARERRAEAERRVEEAAAALKLAADARADRSRAVDTATKHKAALEARQREVRQRLAELQRQLAELQPQLRGLEAEVATAAQTELVAARQRDQAEKTHETALRGLEQAQQHLTESPLGG